jgi:hypothetical protein
MSDWEAWRAEYGQIARELVAASMKLDKLIDAPDTEPMAGRSSRAQAACELPAQFASALNEK